MNRLAKEIEAIIIEHKPTVCELCGDKVYYQHSGAYECKTCHHIMYDDFGKIKQYLDQHGPSPAMAITGATGISSDIVDVFLRKGRLEIPEGSRYYIGCQKCGCSIRYGRYCPSCMKETVTDLRTLCAEDEGERPKYELNPDRFGKIHFFKHRRT